MNVFVIPSWYPSEAHPSTGIFFKEQSELLARHAQNIRLGISVWGQHEPSLWLPVHKPLSSLIKLASRPSIKKKDVHLNERCVEFFTPAYTWSRKIGKGNAKGIQEANEANFQRFTQAFGPPDLIHAHVAYPAGVIAQKLAKKHGIPFLITEHMSPFPMPSLKSIFKSKILPVLATADRVFAVSKALAMDISSYAIGSEVLSNFIDDEQFMPGSERKGGKMSLLAVGRLEKQKNYSLMLQAMGKLRDAGVDFELKIIGSGSMANTLQRLTQQLSLDTHVEWLGECSREGVSCHMKNADVLLNTSMHENQPVAILEALASGLEVVTTKWAGAQEFARTVNSHLVGYSPKEVVAALVTLSKEGVRPKSQIRALFDAHYSTRKQVDQLISRYEMVVNRAVSKE
ncbi:glycosyltransferase [Marinoscillum furvescens]|uniref:Glycosyltransferase involved in cell wall biosynthesis n=1 Tax=Marinoscillum furvescens DSM 4134 TaxID=1122208 RepID=A0A3D9L6V7_MARFU|nr:glycosyltransferase [Marinoscillum furvescens]REE01030.1 glycosyltransferase involved in cell wall biosynthesis [Marinoscillum furvescens DSM 4134]